MRPRSYPPFLVQVTQVTGNTMSLAKMHNSQRIASDGNGIRIKNSMEADSKL
jgi:hypothetical protein